MNYFNTIPFKNKISQFYINTLQSRIDIPQYDLLFISCHIAIRKRHLPALSYRDRKDISWLAKKHYATALWMAEALQQKIFNESKRADVGLQPYGMFAIDDAIFDSKGKPHLHGVFAVSPKSKATILKKIQNQKIRIGKDPNEVGTINSIRIDDMREYASAKGISVDESFDRAFRYAIKFMQGYAESYNVLPDQLIRYWPRGLNPF